MAASGGAYKFLLEMVDKLSRPAKAAGSALDRLRERVKAAEDSIEVGKATIGAAGQEIANAFSALAEGDATGAISGIANAIGDVAQLLDLVVPGLGQAASALIKVTGGILAGGAGLAIEAADFKGDMLGALTAITGSSEAAADTFAAVRGIVDGLPISEEKGFDMAKRLLNIGVGQAEIGEALKAAANLQQVMGEGAMSKLEGILAQAAAGGSFKAKAKQLAAVGVKEADLAAAIAKRMGISTADALGRLRKGLVDANTGAAALTETINGKLGGIAADQLGDLDVMASKFKDNLRRMFEDVDSDGALKALGDLAKAFDVNTEHGKALKGIVTGTFNAFFSAVAATIPYVKFAFYELVIISLRLYIALKPAIAYVKELLGGAGGGDVMLTIVKALVYTFATLAIVIGGIIAFVVALNAGFIALVYFIVGSLPAAFNAITTWASQAWAWVESIFSPAGASAIASAMIDGLVGGLFGGTGRVVGAMTNLGASALGAVKGVLGIASPSKAMEEIAGHTAAGFTNTIDAEAPAAAASLTALVTPPTSLEQGAGSRGGGGGMTFSVGAISVTVTGGGNVGEDAKRGVLDALEQFAMQIGGSTSPVGAGA